MIILGNELLKNNRNFIKLFEEEKNNINNVLKSQVELKEIILSYMQKVADCTENNIDENYIDSFLNFLEELKNSLNYCNENILYINNLLDTINQLHLKSEKNNINFNFEFINNINSKYEETNNVVSKNTLKINTFLSSALTFTELKFIKYAKVNPAMILDKDQPNAETSLNESSKLDTKAMQTKDASNDKKDEMSQNTNVNSKYVEDTLIISSAKGKVFLPYTLSELNELLEKNPDSFSDIDDVIDKKFTLPLSSFKDLSIARFREAFKLMKRKEKSSIKDAFELGIELLFNYNLHPAIISACKNLDELDIYLDYLDSNETDKFDCFNIIFEMAPVLSKKKH